MEYAPVNKRRATSTSSATMGATPPLYGPRSPPQQTLYPGSGVGQPLDGLHGAAALPPQFAGFDSSFLAPDPDTKRRAPLNQWAPPLRSVFAPEYAEQTAASAQHTAPAAAPVSDPFHLDAALAATASPLHSPLTDYAAHGHGSGAASGAAWGADPPASARRPGLAERVLSHTSLASSASGHTRMSGVKRSFSTPSLHQRALHHHHQQQQHEQQQDSFAPSGQRMQHARARNPPPPPQRTTRQLSAPAVRREQEEEAYGSATATAPAPPGAAPSLRTAASCPSFSDVYRQASAGQDRRQRRLARNRASARLRRLRRRTLTEILDQEVSAVEAMIADLRRGAVVEERADGGAVSRQVMHPFDASLLMSAPHRGAAVDSLLRAVREEVRLLKEDLCDASLAVAAATSDPLSLALLPDPLRADLARTLQLSPPQQQMLAALARSQRGELLRLLLLHRCLPAVERDSVGPAAVAVAVDAARSALSTDQTRALSAWSASRPQTPPQHESQGHTHTRMHAQAYAQQQQPQQRAGCAAALASNAPRRSRRLARAGRRGGPATSPAAAVGRPLTTLSDPALVASPDHCGVAAKEEEIAPYCAPGPVPDYGAGPVQEADPHSLLR